ncbi:uncharacterized protein LOC128568993 [Nycticebus coucang]|uniref:uncharacterized protein LOC128568993 n=1 Tax=Nycticebus coucang TaxID=9470 RepID=UPI00234C8969|nr:uncharacterized protein LOC128568993 [Nycticebus coucang]
MPPNRLAPISVPQGATPGPGPQKGNGTGWQEPSLPPDVRKQEPSEGASWGQRRASDMRPWKQNSSPSPTRPQSFPTEDRGSPPRLATFPEDIGSAEAERSLHPGAAPTLPMATPEPAASAEEKLPAHFRHS